jgi:hypothetical protein
MKEREDNEKMINKLIKKRKAENEAFAKLLHAIELKGAELKSTGKSNDQKK